MSNDVLDLKSPSTGSERVVSKFLRQDTGVRPPSVAARGYKEENEQNEEFSKADKEKVSVVLLKIHFHPGFFAGMLHSTFSRCLRFCIFEPKILFSIQS